MEAHDCNFHEGISRCINDRCVLHQAMRTLSKNLRDVAVGERCFDLGRYHGAWLEDAYPDPQPWSPGRGLSADHECQDCGAPLRTDDAAEGFRTCEQCAAQRRETR